MGEKKPEPLDFVKDFQEYLTQQTHHVNMISGSVSGDKEAEALQGGRLILILLNNSFFINILILVCSYPCGEDHYSLMCVIPVSLRHRAICFPFKTCQIFVEGE